MKWILYFLLLLPFVYGSVAPDAICFELRHGTVCIVPNNETESTSLFMENGYPFVIDSDLTVKGDITTDVEANEGFKVGSGTPSTITYDGQDAYVTDDMEIGSDLVVKNTLQIDTSINTTNATFDGEINATTIKGESTDIITGLFNFIGSVTNWVTNLFVTNVYAQYINATEINGTTFYGDGSKLDNLPNWNYTDHNISNLNVDATNISMLYWHQDWNGSCLNTFVNDSLTMVQCP